MSAETKNDQIKDLKIAIVGLGLMGGSLAMALKSHVKAIIAIDSNSRTIENAIEQGLVIEASSNLATGIKNADLIVLATPVNTIIELLDKIPSVKEDGCMIIDLGSTKREICYAMDQLPARFDAIGGHPLCGKEVSGLQEAQADLFENHSFVLCRGIRPTQRVDLVAERIIDIIGAYPVFLTPTEHDVIVSATSHLPYVISTILFSLVHSQASDVHWEVSASGFRDTTRLAGSNPDMMSDILGSNRDQLVLQIAQYQRELGRFKELLESKDDATLTSVLKDVQKKHNLYRHHISSKENKGINGQNEEMFDEE